ncbi:MAG TPA: 50S ribosomal protein L4 [Gemmatales bacterium]|nr:50S ribosomal protein L4 [Gemmatales bacterium]
MADILAKMKLDVVNTKGETVGAVEIDPADFGGKINKQLLHDVVVMHEANQRAGTHHTLRRGEVAGSTKKLFRQKGTGNARVGTRRTNKRRGGGTTKGPKPRDYEFHMPKKAVRLARKMAILSKFHDNEAVIIDTLAGTDGKTKAMAGVLKNLKLNGQTLLIGVANADDKTYKSARNIKGVDFYPVADFNTYTILKRKRLLLTKEALDALKKPAAVKAAK